MDALTGIYLSPPSILTHQKPTAPIKKRCTRMVAHSTSHDIHLHTTPLLQIRSSIKLNKVFEDRSSGIVCYRDEKGEVTCEGYDEGPRFHHHHHHHHHHIFSSSSTFTSSDQRDAEVIDQLHRRLLQIVDKSEAAAAKHTTTPDKDDSRT